MKAPHAEPEPAAPPTPGFGTDAIEHPRELLEAALALALPPGSPDAQTPRWPTRPAWSRDHLTRRGIFWIGQTCNLRCHFCYYLDRIEDPSHPQHAFMSLEKAKGILDTLAETYGNTSVDIQGGEFTLWPDSVELIRHAAAIGVSPTIITNGLAIADPDLVRRYRDAGVRDFLLSVHGLGIVHDEVVRRRGAFDKMMQAIANLRAAGVPFRFNTVVSRAATRLLPEIAELGVRTGAQVVNFLALNPFDDQRTGKRTADNVPSYAEVSGALDAALDVLAAGGVEGNARYFPLCVVAERHRPSAHTFQQLSFDLHENDFASWSWTGLEPQRTAAGGTSPAMQLGPRARLGPLQSLARRLGARPRLGPALLAAKRGLDRAVSAAGLWIGGSDEVERYLADGRLRAHEHCGYRFTDACDGCDARAICNGIHGDHAEFFADPGLTPIRTGRPVRDPLHFSRDQYKVIHPLDLASLGE